MAELHKVTVNLIDRAYAAVLRASSITGHSQTDTINRAVQVYDFIQTRLEEGYSLQLQRGDLVEKIELL